MATDSDSAEDTPFTDCATSETDGGHGGRRKRQISVNEMVRRAEDRKAKRLAHSRGTPSPGKAGNAAPPGAARPAAEPAREVELNATSLAAIQQLIVASVAKVMESFEKKFEHLENRISILESEGMDKELQVKKLSEQLETQMRINSELHKQVESIDANCRLSSLILTCSEFEMRYPNEDIEKRVVELLNRRFGDLGLTTADIQVAHRLQRDSKVIVKFIKRRVRDAVYDGRFELARRGAEAGAGARGGTGGRRLEPLYINESLSPTNRDIYNALLEARRPSNGARVASVFSRRGVVFCRRERGGANVMVPDLPSLRRILGGDGGLPPDPRQVPRLVPPPGGPAVLTASTRGHRASAADGRPAERAAAPAAPSAAGGSAPGDSSGGAVAEQLPLGADDGPVPPAPAAPSSRTGPLSAGSGAQAAAWTDSADRPVRMVGGGDERTQVPG